MDATPMQQRIIDVLADGRWHHSWEFVAKAHMVDYRRRLTELNAKYPGRFISRYRKTSKGRGGPSKDWLDLWQNVKVRERIREVASDVYIGNRTDTDIIVVHGVALAVAQLVYLDLPDVVDIIAGQFCDPYGIDG